MNNYPYYLGGCLPINANSYVKRQADEDIYEGIKAGDFCYVLNSRQMGKSSLRVRTIQKLQAEGIFCASIDMTEIASFEITPSEWYVGIIDSIVGSLKLNYIFNIDDWWETYSKLSHVKKFSKFIGDFLLNAEVRSISFHPHKQLLAYASHDRTIKLWNLDGKLLQTLVGHQHKVRDVSWSKDGKILASASADSRVILWSENGKLLQTLRGHRDWVETVSFSPDAQLLASGGTDKTIKLWHLETGELLQTLENDASVKGLNFSADGKLLASASGKAIALWSRQGKKFQLLKKIAEEENNGLIQSISFSRDVQTIASAAI